MEESINVNVLMNELDLKNKVIDMIENSVCSFSEIYRVLVSKEHQAIITRKDLGKLLNEIQSELTIAELGNSFYSMKNAQEVTGELSLLFNGMMILTTEDGHEYAIKRKEAKNLLAGDIITALVIPEIKNESNKNLMDTVIFKNIISNTPHQVLSKITTNLEDSKQYIKFLERGNVISIPIDNVDLSKMALENKENRVFIGELQRNENQEIVLKYIKDIDYQSNNGFETQAVIDFYNLNDLNINYDTKENDTGNVLAYHDLTNLPFVTIDSSYTKDIDDAICAIKDNDGYQLYVAIADVSYYVKEGSEIDKLALEKTSSVYLPHKTLHMLPKELSEDLCSLNPMEEKRALVCKISLNNDLSVNSYTMIPSIIKSKAKLTYDGVSNFFETKELEVELNDRKTEKSIKDSLNLLLDVAEKNYICDTSLFAEKKELGWKLNNNGKIENLYFIDNNTKSQKIVETTMLMANKAAAQFLSNNNIKQGFFRNQLNPYETMNVNEEILTDEEKITFLKKNIKPAFYENANQGHYGLKTDFYTHFTSPIRRYSDLTVHRLIKEILYFNQPITTTDKLLAISDIINEKQKDIKSSYNKSKNLLIYEYAERCIGKWKKLILYK